MKKKRCLPRKPDDKTQPQITKILPVSTQKAPPKHEKLIIDFIVKGLHAFSTVEEEGFRNLVQGNLINDNTNLQGSFTPHNIYLSL